MPAAPPMPNAMLACVAATSASNPPVNRQIIANQIALRIDRLIERGDEAESAPPSAHPAAPAKPQRPARTRRLTYYRSDDAIFVGR
jgi:hypothetical protein